VKNKLISSLLLSLLLIGILTAALDVSRVAAAQATLSIYPSTVSETPSNINKKFTVSVKVQNVTDLFGLDINITWDNTLITFASLDNSSLSTIWPSGFFEPLSSPGYQSGAGYVDFAAVATGGPSFNGTGTLYSITFNIVKACNFPLSTSIHFSMVKLSDSGANPISATLIDGQYTMSAIVPDIDFNLINPNTSKPWEYGKYFEVQVNVTQISSHLTGYNLKINYTSQLLDYYSVNFGGGILDTGSVDSSTLGTVHVSGSSSTPFIGNNGLLFTLIFEIKFNNTNVTHVWRTANSPNQLTANIWLVTSYGSLTFQEGTISISGVTAPSPVVITINLIKGDVECNGQVNILDLVYVAHYYDQKVQPYGPAPAIVDLKTDGLIDIYDLVEVASNFGYYVPDSPPS
jgi:hypothetical protein